MKHALLVFLACYGLALAAAAQAPATERVSVDSAGVEGNLISSDPSVSADGRFVTFESHASNLVPRDTNGLEDVFVRDRQTGQTTRVSVDSAGVEGNGDSSDPSITADGRFVAFWSSATNLVPGDTNGAPDIFVHDRQTGQTTRVSVSSAGAEGTGVSRYPSVSADGRFVAFESHASNLVPGDSNLDYDIFVHDRQTGQTTRVSVDSAGVEADDDSFSPSISADGRFVAFYSWATNLVPGDTNGHWDIFVHDRQTGQTTRVSVDSAGVEGNDDSRDPSISADGRFVAFESDASNLVPGDTNYKADVFVHDRQTGRTARVSVDSAGMEGNGLSSAPSVSGDGRLVAFYSWASNLVPGDANYKADIFVHDRQTGQTTRVNVDSAGVEGNGSSYQPSISADGCFVAFQSYASNLVPGDTNGVMDVFVRTPVGPPLTQSALVRGQPAWFLVAGALPGEFVRYYYSLVGLGSGPCHPLGTPCLDLLPPVVWFGQATADSAGEATLLVTIPYSSPLLTTHTQAVIVRGYQGLGSVTTNTYSADILP